MLEKSFVEEKEEINKYKESNVRVTQQRGVYVIESKYEKGEETKTISMNVDQQRDEGGRTNIMGRRRLSCFFFNHHFTESCQVLPSPAHQNQVRLRRPFDAS